MGRPIDEGKGGEDRKQAEREAMRKAMKRQKGGGDGGERIVNSRLPSDHQTEVLTRYLA